MRRKFILKYSSQLFGCFLLGALTIVLAVTILRFIDNIFLMYFISFIIAYAILFICLYNKLKKWVYKVFINLKTLILSTSIIIIIYNIICYLALRYPYISGPSITMYYLLTNIFNINVDSQDQLIPWIKIIVIFFNISITYLITILSYYKGKINVVSTDN